MKKLALVTSLLLTFGAISTASANEPISAISNVETSKKIDSSSVGVQLFMWNWASVETECVTKLGPAGYDWVLVMPPQEHVTGPEWWTHYQPVSYKIESRLGTRAEFAKMVAACNQAGVKVIADAVINHMVGGRSGTGFAGTEFAKYDHPGLYSADDFHAAKKSISNWNSVDEVQGLELLGLSDLATEKPAVRQKIARYLNDLLSLGVYGLRIDAARHIPVADLLAIKALLPADTYFLQEVAAKLNPAIADYYPAGDVWEFDWVSLMTEAFQFAGQASKLTKTVDLNFLTDTNSTVTMVSNHDTERNGQAISTWDAAGQQLAFIYTLASTYGKPMMYSGYAFDEYDAAPRIMVDGKVANATCPAGTAAPKPRYEAMQFTCQHRWKAVEGMIAWRDSVGVAAETALKGSAGILSFGRGAAGHLIINSNDKLAKVKVKTALAAGAYCDLISGGRTANKVAKKCLGTTVTVDKSGFVSASIGKQAALAISKDSRRK